MTRRFQYDSVAEPVGFGALQVRALPHLPESGISYSPLYQYQQRAEPVRIIVPFEWHPDTERPPKDIARRQWLNPWHFFVEPPIPKIILQAGDYILLDSPLWQYQALAEPVSPFVAFDWNAETQQPRRLVRQAEPGGAVLEPLPVVPFEWLPEIQIPARDVRRNQFGFLFFSPSPQPEVTLDMWFQPISGPPRRVAPRDLGQFAWSGFTPAEAEVAAADYLPSMLTKFEDLAGRYSEDKELGRRLRQLKDLLRRESGKKGHRR